MTSSLHHSAQLIVKEHHCGSAGLVKCIATDIVGEKQSWNTLYNRVYDKHPQAGYKVLRIRKCNGIIYGENTAGKQVEKYARHMHAHTEGE